MAAMRCYECGREFTKPQQWGWDIRRHTWPARGTFRAPVCRGIVQCGKRVIDRYGRDAIRPGMRSWLGLDDYRPAWQRA